MISYFMPMHLFLYRYRYLYMELSKYFSYTCRDDANNGKVEAEGSITRPTMAIHI